MVTLTKILGALVRWVTASRRRMVAAVAIPAFALIAVAGPAGTTLARSIGDAAGGGSEASRSGDDAPAEPSPTPVPIGPSNSPRPHPQAPAEAAAVARSYATTVNAHDARPGRDRDFLDSYRRVRPYVTPQLFGQITEASTRGGYQWATWSAQRALVTVRVDRIAVADGAPAPTATAATLRVLFTQVVTPQSGRPTTEPGNVALVVTRQPGGRWLVSSLLAS